MLEQINQLDQNIFFFINNGLSNPFFDWLMPYLRNRYFWTPLYLFMAVFFVRNYSKQGWLILLFMGLTFGFTDYFSSSILKPSFERLRPCNDPSIKAEVNNLIPCGTGFSLPSSHAANHFALAFFLITIFYSRWKAILPLAVLWAFSISFAQVYVGVHYPFDVTAGGIIGGMIGYVFAILLLNTKGFKEWKSGN
ncbi:phosphatase PAP2 family protein [Daejeonella lutea]|uniref:Undecaprenyl-diphosphatase n=1 Tax=Daejeonella lutea TaxID=572036 RepID=A0A1T5AWL1_9SPHI|nr:phosphatase PAP2 family protein [Daejeonella lutea]SKB39356.1 undecaprenyl-diphosphatase [Daejeonella lutea]